MFVDRRLLQCPLAGKHLQVEHVGDGRRLPALEGIGAVAEGGGIDNLRNEAVGLPDHQGPGKKVLGRRRAVGSGSQPGVGVDLASTRPSSQATMASKRRSYRRGPKSPCRIRPRPSVSPTPSDRQIVIDDLHLGVRRHVGVVVGLLLAGCIGAAPRRRCSDFPPGRSRPPAQRPPLLPRNSVFVSSISPLFCPCRSRRDIPVSTRFPRSFRGTYPPIPRHAGVDTQAPCNPRRPSRGESVCLHGEKHDAGRLVP